MEKIGLQAVLEDQQFVAGLKQMQAGIDQMVKSAGSVEGASKGMGDAIDQSGKQMGKTGDSAVEMASKMQIVKEAMETVKQLAQQGLELAQLGAMSERVEQRFNAFAEAAGGGTVMLQAFQDGAGGTVSKMDAMASASKLMQMGLVTDADSMSRVVEMATRLGDQTADATSRVADFALMLANQSIPRLDNFGISSGRVRARIQELQDTIPGMSREAAFMQATLEEGSKSLDILGERVDDSAAAFERAQAKMADLKVEIGQKLAPVFAKLMDFITELDGVTLTLITSLGGALGIVTKFTGGLGGLVEKLGMTGSQFGAVGLAIGGAVVAYELINRAQADFRNKQVESSAALDDWIKKLNDAINVGKNASEAIDGAAREIMELRDEYEKANIVVQLFNDIGGQQAQRTEDVNQALLEASGSHEEYIRLVEQYNAAQEDANAKIFLYANRLTDTTKGVVAFTEAEGDLVRSEKELADSIASSDAAMLNLVSAYEDGIYTGKLMEDQLSFTEAELKLMNAEMESSDQAMLGYVNAMQSGIVVTDEHEIALRNEYQALQAQEAAAERSKQKLEELRQKQLEAKRAADEHRLALLDLAERLTGMEDPADRARAALDLLRKQYEDGKLSGEDYAKAVEQTQDRFELVDPKARLYANALDVVTNAVGRGIIPASQFDEILIDMNKQAEEGAIDIQGLLDQYGTVPTTFDPATGAVSRASDAFVDATGTARDMKHEFEQIPSAVSGLEGAMSSAGSGIVNSLRAGFAGSWGGFMSELREALAEAGGNIPSSRPRDPTSPLYHLQEQGAAIATELMKGFEEGAPELSGAIKKWAEEIRGYFDISGVFAGLGGAAAQVIGERTKGLEQGIKDIETQIMGIPKAMGWTGQFGSAGDVQRAVEQWMANYRRMMAMAETPEERLALQRQYEYLQGMLPMFSERNRLQEEFADLNEQVLEFQKAQQQLRFLEYQMRLLEMIKEHGLDAQEILGDLKLGIDADMQEVLAAMTAAMQAMIDQINDELEISSPSRVMQRIGRQMMAGLTVGVAEMAPMPARMMAAPAYALAGGVTTTSLDQSRSLTINAGGNTITNAAEGAAFEERIRRIIRQEMRGY